MIITAVDDRRDLFFVENIYPKNLLDSLNEINHLETPGETEEMQQDYPRKKLHNIDQRYESINKYVQSLQSKIEENINIEFLSCDTAFWLDLPGFEMESHLDNDGVYAAMQIYLSHNSIPMPTVFYNKDGSIRFQPEYRVNSGYLMLNNSNQWHAMPYTVPKNEYRLTSYTWIYKK